MLIDNSSSEVKNRSRGEKILLGIILNISWFYRKEEKGAYSSIIRDRHHCHLGKLNGIYSIFW